MEPGSSGASRGDSGSNQTGEIKMKIVSIRNPPADFDFRPFLEGTHPSIVNATAVMTPFDINYESSPALSSHMHPTTSQSASATQAAAASHRTTPGASTSMTHMGSRLMNVRSGTVTDGPPLHFASASCPPLPARGILPWENMNSLRSPHQNQSQASHSVSFAQVAGQTYSTTPQQSMARKRGRPRKSEPDATLTGIVCVRCGLKKADSSTKCYPNKHFFCRSCVLPILTNIGSCPACGTPCTAAELEDIFT